MEPTRLRAPFRGERAHTHILTVCAARFGTRSVLLYFLVLACTMVLSQQDLLREAWLGGRDGNLSALSEARAWALCEVWRDGGKTDYGMFTFIAGRLKKVGGGRPTLQAVKQLLERIDGDRDWFPGKSSQQRHGPSSVITPTNQSIVARSAMSMKERGVEPTYSNLVAACPK